MRSSILVAIAKAPRISQRTVDQHQRSKAQISHDDQKNIGDGMEARQKATARKMLISASKEEPHKRRGASVGRPTQQIQVTPRHQLGVVASRDVQALYDVDVIVS